MDETLTNVLAILSTTPDRWRTLTEVVPGPLLSASPALGEWSAVECLRHMIDTEHLFAFRLKAFMAGQDFPAFNPDAEGTGQRVTNPVDLANEFTNLRDINLQAIQTIQPSDFSRTARHAELGQVTLEQMLNEWAAHDLNHTVQAEEALMQPFIQASGPWRKYFTAHMSGG